MSKIWSQSQSNTEDKSDKIPRKAADGEDLWVAHDSAGTPEFKSQ